MYQMVGYYNLICHDQCCGSPPGYFSPISDYLSILDISICLKKCLQLKISYLMIEPMTSVLQGALHHMVSYPQIHEKESLLPLDRLSLGLVHCELPTVVVIKSRQILCDTFKN